MMKPSQMPDYQVFTYWHVFFLVGAILTYFVDLVLDIVVSGTYIYDGYYWYGFINLSLVLIPTLLVQIFSIRWFQMDSMMKKSYWYIHASLLGVVQRYVMVLKFGLEAMHTGYYVDYQRFYQQQSDVCMLRLFDSFAESAPQLVFHLYVMILKSDWPLEQAAWTGTSAVVSMVSLGWGIAAYSSAVRMTREDKNKLGWPGMIFQTLWRAGMLAARLTALVTLALALDHWAFIVIFVHWLLMTGWVLWQNTDFCQTLWEERLYNALVGVIYCFCFFNLKEGKSRYRATLFYTIIIVENFTFVSVFYYVKVYSDQGLKDSFWMSVGAFVVVTIGTLIGLVSMLLYYRYFHPAGPIKPYIGESVDFSYDPELKVSPDFVTYDDTSIVEKRKPSNPVRHSRSFKNSCPPALMKTQFHSSSTSDPCHNSLNGSPQSATVLPGSRLGERIDSTYGTDSNRTITPQDIKNENGHNVSSSSSLSTAFNNETYASVDSKICQRTKDGQNLEVSYAKVGPRTPKTNDRKSSDETYMSVHPDAEKPRHYEPEVLLKRSPVLRDVTTAQISSTNKFMPVEKDSSYKPLGSIHGAGQGVNRKLQLDTKQFSAYKPLSSITGAGKHLPSQSSSTNPGNGCSQTSQGKNGSREKLTAPLTIIVPNISRAFARHSRSRSGDETADASDKTISIEMLNPKMQEMGNFPPHDYENLALININRTSLAKGIAHWRTYSDMANEKHDDSVAVERKSKDYSNYNSLHYFDIYPLSREIKEQLYRSLTPISTAATVATSDDGILTTFTESDTYEPIETFQDLFNGKTTGNKFEANSSSKKQDSLNETYGDLKVPIPMTLIHHDGQKLTTRQIISMESLREVLLKHEKVPMDDPQDRGDLYLLAPMRLLLSPIAEEPEMSETQQSHAADSQQELNKSLMTVISEILNTTSNKSFFHSTALSMHQQANSYLNNKQNSAQTDSIHSQMMMQGSQHSTFPDGHSQDSIDSASSLVNIIDEIRNNSLCNLLYMTNSSANIKATCDQEKSNDCAKESRKETPTVKSPSSVPKSISEKSSVAPSRRNTPLYTSIGSRKNLLELAGKNAEGSILNTPKKSSGKPEKLSLAQPLKSPSLAPINCQGLPNSQMYDVPQKPRAVEKTFLEKRDASNMRKSNFVQSKVSKFSQDSSSLMKERNFGENEKLSTSIPKFADAQVSSGYMYQHLGSPVLNHSRPLALQFPALSPSAKYNSDNTPTPPMRENHFVRNTNNSKLPRRKFSILRDQFESPELRRKSSVPEVYENVSNNLMKNADEKKDQSRSVPSVFPGTGIRPDEQYKSFNSQFENRSHWSTASFQKTSQQVIGQRNGPDRRSMFVMSDHMSKNMYPLPPRKLSNKENQAPSLRGKNQNDLHHQSSKPPPALPPRLTNSNPSARSTLSPNSRVFSRLI